MSLMVNWFCIDVYVQRENDLPAQRYESILSRHSLRRHNCLTPGRQSPSSWPKRSVQYPSIFDLWEVYNSIGLDFDVVGFDGREQDVGSFFGKGFIG